MLKIQNNRIVVADASMELPNGMYINGKKSKTGEIVFSSDSGKYELKVSKENTQFPSKQKIKRYISFFGKKIIEMPTRITINGLNGYYAIYKTRNSERYTGWLQKNQHSSEYLKIEISNYSKKETIDEIMHKDEVVSFFCDLRVN